MSCLVISWRCGELCILGSGVVLTPKMMESTATCDCLAPCRIPCRYFVVQHVQHMQRGTGTRSQGIVHRGPFPRPRSRYAWPGWHVSKAFPCWHFESLCFIPLAQKGLDKVDLPSNSFSQNSFSVLKHCLALSIWPLEMSNLCLRLVFAVFRTCAWKRVPVDMAEFLSFWACKQHAAFRLQIHCLLMPDGGGACLKSRRLWAGNGTQNVCGCPETS